MDLYPDLQEWNAKETWKEYSTQLCLHYLCFPEEVCRLLAVLFDERKKMDKADAQVAKEETG